jgi:hypothetical protein
LNGYDGSLPQGERSQTFASNSFSFNNSWGQATLNLSAATISQSYSAWIGKELNIVIGFNSGNVFSVDNVTLTAAPITAVPIIVIGNNLIGDFETGPNDFGSFWKNGSFAAYDHSWGDVADQTPPLANGGQFYAYTSGEFGQIGKTMGTLQANTNYTLSLNYQSIYDSEDRPYIELLAYNATSRVETLLAAGYAGPTSGVWRTGSLSLSAAEISANNPALIGQEFNVKISGYAIAVDNVTLTAAPTYAGWAADKAGSQAANLDWDNDGVSNGIEYFMNATPGLTVNPGLVGNRVTWPNGGNISSSAYGTKFVVQSSIDLVTWADVPSNDPNLENTPNSVTYTFSVYDADKQFVRLKVTLN